MQYTYTLDSTAAAAAAAVATFSILLHSLFDFVRGRFFAFSCFFLFVKFIQILFVRVFFCYSIRKKEVS